jgi:hypothetical protein
VLTERSRAAYRGWPWKHEERHLREAHQAGADSFA